VRTLALLLLALTACRREDPAAARAQADEAVLLRVDGAATRLATTLRGRLLTAMREGGPTAAAEVCARDARGVAAQVRAETGIAVGRASLRTRSSANTPPGWVDAWLRAQGERSAQGVTGIRAVQDGHARVLRPIPVEGPCVTCHGDPATIPEGVRAVLAARYPTDRATGYRVGDLRGALWAEVTR
jgi:hypothetical protein